MTAGKEHTVKVFILTGEWMDVKGRNQLKFTGTSNDYGPVEINVTNNPVFFVKRSSDISDLKVSTRRKEINLKNLNDQDVDALYFNTENELRSAAEELATMGITSYESDINPTRRFLMERFINAQVIVTGSTAKRGGAINLYQPANRANRSNPSICSSLNRYRNGQQ